MKAIRVSIYVIAGLLVLLVLGVAVFAMTFNPNKYKGQIESLVKQKTGRTLSLKGDLEVAFYPALGAKVNGVTLSERDNSQEFLHLDSAHVSVALMPLLRGEAIVDKIRVSGLKARVVKEKDGTFNFSDLMEAKGAESPAQAEKPAPKAPQPEAKKEEKKAEKSEKAAVGFDIAGIQLDRSAVSYIDRQSGQEIALNDIELSTGRIAEKADGKLSLKTAAKGKNPDVDLKIDIGSGYKFDLPAKAFALSNLDAKIAGAAAGMKDLSVNAKGDVAANPEKNEYRVKGFNLDVKGQQEGKNLEARIAAPELLVSSDTAKGGAITADLRLKEAARDLEAKLKLSGVEGSAKALAIPQLNADISMVEQGKPAVKIPVTGSLKADLEKQTANADLQAKFDESNIQAKLGLAKFTPPSYLFDINVDKLNLDRYTGDEQKAAAKPKPAPPTEGKAPDKPAPAPEKKAEEDSPVDLSFLKGLNANGRLAFGALQAKGLKLANLKAEVKAADGRLDVAPHSANLYEGSVAGAITAHADGRVAVKETLNGVSVGPLLRDFAQKDILEGKGTVALDVTAAGKSVNAMKKSLGGNARLQLKDGAVKGINIAESLRKAKTALGSQEARAEARKDQSTDFSELKASFTIKNGVAHNEDLEMKAPLFRLGGKGDIDIGSGTIDYVAKATVVATTKGQGGADLQQLAGLTVPVHLKGPFDDMKYDVNYSAVAADAARTRVGEKVRSKLEERLGISKPAPEGQPQEGQSSSGSSRIDRLKGLLGR